MSDERRTHADRAADDQLRGLIALTAAKVTDGGGFILDAPAHVPAIWGTGPEVLWAQGEPLMICGPQGVGKSTIAQQLVLARIGIRPAEVLGLPVTPDPGRRVIYIAADRPNQIARSLRRMVTTRDRQGLTDRLLIHRGPLAFDITDNPAGLAAWAKHHNAGTLVIDSLKDIAMPLSEDRVGATVNNALQRVIAEGIEVLDLHHQRKPQEGNKQPHALGDVYGSTWLTSGHGSVVLLWGEPGDAVIELRHLKQPADTVGPLELVHDHDAGTTRVHARPTITQILADAGHGITVADAALRLWGPGATRNELEKTRRKLETAFKTGHAERIDGETSTTPVRYLCTTSTVRLREAEREAPRQLHAASRTPVNTGHANLTAPHGHASTPPAPLRGRRDAEREATTDEQQAYENALSLIAGDAA